MSPGRPSAFTAALLSEAATPAHPKRMRAFAELVGTWRVHGRRLDQASGDWLERDFTWIVALILEGRAVQDVEVIATSAGPETVATGIRVYDTDAGVWRVSFFGPKSSDYCHLIASAHRDGIRQDGAAADDRPIRWNFSEITADRYVWDAWVSNDDGATWELTEHNEGTRVA